MNEQQDEDDYDATVDALDAQIDRLSAENTFLRHQLHEIHELMQKAANRLEASVKATEIKMRTAQRLEAAVRAVENGQKQPPVEVGQKQDPIEKLVEKISEPCSDQEQS
jgi:predicted RNase H-like nuclease (RuvC/YqgF family)